MPAAPASTFENIRFTALPWTIRLYFFCSWLIGWWMVYDGLRQRLFGDFTRLDGRLGPWADLAQAAGLPLSELGWPFIVLGCTFVSSSFGLALRRGWGFNIGLTASVVGLLYLGFGLPVSAACLVLILLPPTRRYLR